jgi:hypothetical protein
MSKNRTHKIIFRPKREEVSEGWKKKPYNEELQDVHSSGNIWIIK